MQRGVLQAGAWTLATGAAVTLSWVGVHAVLTETAYDPPRALPVTGHSSSTAHPRVSSTHRPRPSPARSSRPTTSPAPHRSHPANDRGGNGGSGTGGSGSAPHDDGRPTEGHTDGRVRGVTAPGGRAVFDMHAHSASLVSATPDGGWSMQVWKQPTWIRVTFYRGDEASSVFCRWDDGPPRIEKAPN